MALTSKGHFKIGNVEFKAKSIKVNYESLASEDSGRTADGVFHVNWILNRIRKVEIEMPPCLGTEASTLLALVQGKIYELTYFDTLTNAEKTIQVYTSNSQGDLYSGVLYNGLWQGVGFNAIEVSGEKV